MKTVRFSWTKAFATVGIAATGILVAACSGGTDGGDQDFSGSDFVADGKSGSIELNVIEKNIEVSQLSGFRVLVKDASGRPVPNLKISCDSEAGVAIIEPTTGSEITDSSGQISGKIGCAAPGSYQFGCRLPVGANMRKFETILCGGEVPTGFDGFPGASGGGLGTGGTGGVGNGGGDGEPGGVDTTAVRITSVVLNDGGGDGPSVDVNQDDCSTATSGTPNVELEPFFDTTVKVRAVNNTNSNVRFTSLSYTVPNSDGSGTRFTSQRISFIGPSEVPANGGAANLVTLFASAANGRKRFTGNNTNIPTDLGFTNFTITLEGVNDRGESIVASGSGVGSFANFDRCGG